MPFSVMLQHTRITIANELSNRLNQLSPEAQKRILNILEILIAQELDK